MTFAQRSNESMQQFGDRFTNEMAITACSPHDRALANTFRRGIRDPSVREYIDLQETLSNELFKSVYEIAKAAIDAAAMIDRRRHDARASALRSAGKLCHTCRQPVHIASDCPTIKSKATVSPNVKRIATKPKADTSKITCHRCSQMGHYCK